MSSSSDFLQDVHNFSGSPQRWSDFEIPGEKYFKKSFTPFLLCAFICVHFYLFTFMLLFLGFSQVIPSTTDLCQTWATQSGATSSQSQEATEDGSKQVLYIKTNSYSFYISASCGREKVRRPLSNMYINYKINPQVGQVVTFSPLCSLIRVWDTEANVSRWPSARSSAIGWHLGVAGGRGLSPDWEPATQSHSLVAPPASVPVSDVRVQPSFTFLFSLHFFSPKFLFKLEASGVMYWHPK